MKIKYLNKVIFFISLICVSFFSSCNKVTDLSDEAGIDSFEILSHYPEKIELGTPYIDGKKIYIPVNKGAFLFPLTIKANVTPSSNANEIVAGATFNSFDSIPFGTHDIHNHKFYAIAASGKPVEYEIILIIKDQKDETDIFNFSVLSFSPQNALLAKKALINTIDKKVQIAVVDVVFPIDIQASFELSEGSKITNTKTRQTQKEVSLHFNIMTDKIEYIVEAENGKTQPWIIELLPAVEYNQSMVVDPNIIGALSFDQRKISASIENVLDGYVSSIKVDNESSTLTFYVNTGTADVSKGIKIIPDWGLWENSQILKNPEDHILFTGFDTPKEIIVLDAVSGVYKKWTVIMSEGDINDVKEFNFNYHDNSGNSLMTLQNECVINEADGTITLYITQYSNLPQAWPLTITPTEIKVSPNAICTLTQLSFDNINSVKSFKVSSGSQVDKTWKVKLVNLATLKKEAEVTQFSLVSCNWEGISTSNLHIKAETGIITIDINTKGSFPLTFKPNVHVSAGAYHLLDLGKEIKFESFADTYSFNVIAENGTIKTWKIVLAYVPQIPNTDFQLWVDRGPSSAGSQDVPNIDPFPGDGKNDIRGWSTANNIFLTGTMKTNNGSKGYAAELKTDILTFNGYPKIENIITSATLFLGKFEMNVSGLAKPKEMTTFGIKFDGTPKAITLDAKYKPGEKLQQSIKVSGTKYKLEDVAGQDQGHIWIELVNYSGTDANYKYHGDLMAGLTVLARGEMVFTGETDWKKISIDLVKRSEFSQMKPTHIVIVMASSIKGDQFIGAKGSTLTVDNIELVY